MLNMFFSISNILDGCKCSTYVSNKTRQGNCMDIWKDGFWCYVSQPSDCSDLVESTSHPGKQWSYDACKIDEGDYIQYCRFFK